MHPETKKRIEAYRAANQAECAGLPDHMVECLLTRAYELSTEVMTHVLANRGYDVRLVRKW